MVFFRTLEIPSGSKLEGHEVTVPKTDYTEPRDYSGDGELFVSLMFLLTYHGSSYSCSPLIHPILDLVVIQVDGTTHLFLLIPVSSLH